MATGPAHTHRAARFWLTAAVICHLVVFSAAPLLHNHDHASAGCRRQVSANPQCPDASRGCLCRLVGSLAGVPGNGSTERNLVGRTGANPACLACIYLQSTQSGSPLDAAKPAAAPMEGAPAYPPVASDASSRGASFEYPARAPPAVA